MLAKITSAVQARVKNRMDRKPLSVLQKNIEQSPTPRNFTAALTPRTASEIRIIAEIKRASPSAGNLRPDLSTAKLAAGYQKTGAAAISVLTEEDYFRGGLVDLSEVKKTVNIPVLQKDFILEPYQVYESRAAGADAILLITAIHTPEKLRELYNLSVSLGLTPLVEIHAEQELETALALDARVIGINNRNLKTLKTDLDTGYRLLSLMPREKIAVVESGLKTRTEIQAFRKAGASAFLIGETLLRAPDPSLALRDLLSRQD